MLGLGRIRVPCNILLARDLDKASRCILLVCDSASRPLTGKNWENLISKEHQTLVIINNITPRKIPRNFHLLHNRNAPRNIETRMTTIDHSMPLNAHIRLWQKLMTYVAHRLFGIDLSTRTSSPSMCHRNSNNWVWRTTLSLSRIRKLQRSIERPDLRKFRSFQDEEAGPAWKSVTTTRGKPRQASRESKYQDRGASHRGYLSIWIRIYLNTKRFGHKSSTFASRIATGWIGHDPRSESALSSNGGR